MKIVNKIGSVLKTLLEIFLVIGFIVFEEIVWEQVAKPSMAWLASLEILQKLQVKIETLGLYEVLALFVGLFVIVEALGIYAGILFVSGSIISGVILYILKLPVAAFTFWIFSFTKEKLLTVAWFAGMYYYIMAKFDWVKSTRIYRRVRVQIYQTKKYFRNLKAGTFKEDINRVYNLLKELFKDKATK